MNPEVAQEIEIKRKMQFSGKVKKISLAGAVLDIGIDQPAVLHISQLIQEDDLPVKRVEDVLAVGQEVDVWVKKVNPDHVELTMIQPLAYEWRDLKPGMVVKGKVVRIESFGAFVEIGAERPGLVHISEFTHGYVRTPSEILKEGDEIEAQVLEVIRRKKQIKLSMKALQQEPEPVVEEVFQEQLSDSNKPARRKKNRKQGPDGMDDDPNTTVTQQPEPDPTAMELALRDAMEKASKRKQQDKTKKAKRMDREQEDILARTLEHKNRSDS